MAELLRCWRCGEGLADLSLPLARLDECPACTVPLHVCRMCTRFDAAVVRQCREDDADEVLEKERPNFCDYFSPSADAFDGAVAAADEAARAQLDGLFGAGEEAGPAAPGDDLGSAEDLFK